MKKLLLIPLLLCGCVSTNTCNQRMKTTAAAQAKQDEETQQSALALQQMMIVAQAQQFMERINFGWEVTFCTEKKKDLTQIAKLEHTGLKSVKLPKGCDKVLKQYEEMKKSQKNPPQENTHARGSENNSAR